MRFFLVMLLVLVLVFGCRNKTDDTLVAGVGLTVSGVVLEKLDAAPDSYLRLQTDHGEVWAKIPMTELNTGVNVKVVQAQELFQWESPRLQRTFDRLYMGRLETQKQAIAPGTAHAAGCESCDEHNDNVTPPMMGQMGNTGIAADANVPKLEKAPGANGKTVAEIVADGISLQGKTVSVRGQVVKVTSGLRVPNVTGGTWIRIQDGTGDEAHGTHVLTVATDENVNIGDISAFQGKVKIDDTGVLGGRVIVQGAKKINASSKANK